MNKVDVSKFIGIKINKLTILGSGFPYLTSKGHRQTTFVCLCDCGSIKTYHSYSVIKGKSKSCGCSKISKNPNYVHGMTKTRTHRIWRGMIQRCYYKRSPSYKNYGSKNIFICDEWFEFSNFLNDMGECPEGLTLERIDNKGIYEKRNCRWASYKEQANNTSRNRILEHNGEKLTMKQWSEKLNINYCTLSTRINRNKWTTQKALTTA